MKLSQELIAQLSEFRPDPNSRHGASAQKAVYLAGLLQERASRLQTPSERRQQAELDRMLHNPALYNGGRSFVLTMIFAFVLGLT